MQNEIEQILDRERLDVSVIKVINNVLAQYLIKKLPEKQSLENCLTSYTKEKLVRIADENSFEIRKSWRKNKIVQSIEEGILSSIEERFLILGEEKLKLLQRVFNEQSDMDPLSLEEFYLNVYPAALRMGLLYTSLQENRVITVMPEEIKLYLDANLANFAHLKREFSLKIPAWEEMEEVLKAGVHLYGVLNVDTLTDLWRIRHTEEQLPVVEDASFIQSSYEVLPLLAIKNGYYLINDSLFGNSVFSNEEDVKTFYRQRLNKMHINEYKPSKQEIEYYAENSFDRRMSSYKELEQYVFKFYTRV